MGKIIGIDLGTTNSVVAIMVGNELEIAVGAAVQAGVISGDINDVISLDVSPLSIGVETLGGVMTTMIPRNTTLPTQRKRIFTTAAEGQSVVEIHILQGERADANLNRTLGNFQLWGILPGARGVPKIEVTFDVDANGILSVTAKDIATGKCEKMAIAASSGLSEADIQKMVEAAAVHVTEDKLLGERVQRRNELETVCYTLGKSLEAGEHQLVPGDAEPLETLIADARAAVESGDPDRIQSAGDRLCMESQRMNGALHNGAPRDTDRAPPLAGDSASTDSKRGVVDADLDDLTPSP